MSGRPEQSPDPQPTSPGAPVTPLPGPAGSGEVHADAATQVGAEPSIGGRPVDRTDGAAGSGSGAGRGTSDKAGFGSRAGRAAAVAGALAVGARLARTTVRRGQQVVAERRHRAGVAVGAGSERRPLAVTVHRSVEEVGAHPALDGIRALDGVEVLTTAAPGDRGTEVRVRPVEGARWSDVEPGEVRAMLREAKSRLEAGTVAEAARAGGVRQTAANAQLIDLTERAREEGRL